MPELPEMENYKRLLNERITNQPITAVQVNREKSINVEVDVFINHVQNQRIVTVERRAKQLIFELENGQFLLLHLMIGGLMFYGTEEEKPDRTIQIRLSFGDNHLYFIGLRLGYLHLLDEAAIRQELSDLGPEPLDINFSLDAFLKIAGSKTGKLKSTLVDQQFLSGIGNRYSDEICWQAKVLPSRSMDDLENEELVNLFHSIRYILQQGIEHGGYIDQKLFENDLQTGGQLQHFNVYNREGEECPRCGSEIIKEEISSRKSFYCATCQT